MSIQYIEFILVLGCGIKGNIETLDNRPDIKSRNVEMRNELDLFANVLHCHSRPGVKTRHDDIDVIVIRQNTEGIQIIKHYTVLYFSIFGALCILKKNIDIFLKESMPC